MVTITRISFPTESSKEMGKRFMDIPPLPTYITRKGPYIRGELGVGIQLITYGSMTHQKWVKPIYFLAITMHISSAYLATHIT